ncbi:MAG: hydroxymethylbilane synthase [bacterium]
MTRILRLGTRGSPLALAQSQAFADSLMRARPGLKLELRTITTSGDRIQNRFLSEVGGKGLFVKEIEDALLAGEVDLAVHSLKDMPAVLPEGLEIGCYPERRDPHDVLIARAGGDWRGLPEGARVGTTSLRRRLQLKALRPDLRFEMLRGNIDTRLRRLREGAFDAIVLAKAGMQRLGLDLEGAVELPILPAPGQGTLAIEIRGADASLRQDLSALHHAPTEAASLAERRVMRELGGSCNLPLGVYGEMRGDRMRLSAFLSDLEGERHIEAACEGAAADPLGLADQLLARIWERGGREILDAIAKRT